MEREYDADRLADILGDLNTLVLPQAYDLLCMIQLSAIALNEVDRTSILPKVAHALEIVAVSVGETERRALALMDACSRAVRV